MIMFKSVLRSTPRQATLSFTRSSVAGGRQRFISTAPPSQRSRKWKSSAVRWGLAAGAVYYYNTSTVFAEEPEATISRLDTSIHHVQESNLPTLEAIAEEKRARQEITKRLEVQKQKELDAQSQAPMMETEDGVHGEEQPEGEGGMDGLEEEADQQGAFNPETGEINWDCPCLGGMAHGPCGEDFKAAFSCFVHSEEEPKGMECIDKFKNMQDCFRAHPEMYGSELEDDEDELEEEVRGEMAARDQELASQQDDTPPTSSKDAPSQESVPPQDTPVEKTSESAVTTPAPETKNNGDEGGELIPKDIHNGSPSSSKDE